MEEGFGTKSYMVTLTFLTNEEVTPEYFARKIALACARGGALRVGESVHTNGISYKYTHDAETSMKELGLGNDEERFITPIVEKEGG